MTAFRIIVKVEAGAVEETEHVQTRITFDSMLLKFQNVALFSNLGQII